ncbi:major facilitator superfamily domain-containing protein [Xylaria intraflava]|nr:major facilitator superfamily domain-containing protein [Xylaria intraflava]
MEIVSVAETDPLLVTDPTDVPPSVTIRLVLPVAFTAAFAIAATSATTVYVYAAILCDNHNQCEDGDRSGYNAAVTLASFISNATGIVAVGFLRQWAESRPTSGLCLWLAGRALGVGILFVGALTLRSISVAIAGRSFDGLASDNILHCILAAIYIHDPGAGSFSQLMGMSLAWYLIGMSTSPASVSIRPSFTSNFIVAIAILGLSLPYLIAFIPVARIDGQQQPHNDRLTIPPTVAVFFNNCTQDYLFPSIMVDATLPFNATGEENGYIISLAGTNRSGKQKRGSTHANGTNEESAAALASPSASGLRPDVITTLVSTYIKSHAVAISLDKNSTLASLAALESLGGLISPIVVGAIQSKVSSKGRVRSFIVLRGFRCCVYLAQLVFIR